MMLHLRSWSLTRSDKYYMEQDLSKMNISEIEEYLNAEIAHYSLFKHIIVFNNDSIYDNGEINKKIITTLFHEFFHYYLQFNSLFNIEGYIHYFSLIKELFVNRDHINEIIPIIKNFNKLHDPKKYPTALYYFNNWKKRRGDNFRNSTNFRNSMHIESFNERNKEIDIPFKLGKTYIPQITISQSKSSAIRSVYDFGEIALNESMANLMQSYLKFSNGGIPNTAPLLPYQILSHLMYQKGYIHLLPIIIFADLSMQSPSPGYTFLSLEKKYHDLLSESRSQYYEKNFPELIDELKDIYKKEIKSGLHKGYIDYLEILLFKYLKKSINNNPFFLWIYNKFEQGYKRIKKGELPYYLIPMFGDDDLENKIKKLFITFTPPMIADKETKSSYEYVLFSHFNTAEERSEYVANNIFFSGLYQLFLFINTGKIQGCFNYDFCNKSYKDNDCKSRPWCKGQLDGTCEIGLAAKFYNLQSH